MTSSAPTLACPLLWLMAGSFLTACTDAPSPPIGLEDDPTASARVMSIDPPSGPGAMAPSLASGRSATHLTWLEPVDPERRKEFRLHHATFASGAWTPARQLARGDAFFANWADLPGTVERGDGTLYAHWLQKLGADTYAYGVELTRSVDGGETWQPLGLLHDDATPTEHGFVSYVTLADAVQAFWLDGRAMPGGEAMQLRTTRLEGAGAPPPSVLLDARVCECCQTDAAWTAQGPIVVYRDRSESEIRDVGVVRAVKDGWSEPTILRDDGWQIHGCPVNGPAVDADGERVAVAWFTAGENRPRVQVAFSDDAGASFAAPVVVDGEHPLGRVDVVLDPTGRALVSWMGTADERAEIRARPVAPGGELGETRKLVDTTAARSAGVPRMTRHRDDVLLAWVEDAEPSKIRVVRLTPSTFPFP